MLIIKAISNRLFYIYLDIDLKNLRLFVGGFKLGECVSGCAHEKRGSVFPEGSGKKTNS